MDLEFSSDLDLTVTDGEYVFTEQNEGALINAFFTDARDLGSRGYWTDIRASKLWGHSQSRLDDDVANDMTETARELAAELVADGLYEKIIPVVTARNGYMSLYIQCYNKEQLVFDKEFNI